MLRILFASTVLGAAALTAIPDPVSPDPDGVRPIAAVDTVFIET